MSKSRIRNVNRNVEHHSRHQYPSWASCQRQQSSPRAVDRDRFCQEPSYASADNFAAKQQRLCCPISIICPTNNNNHRVEFLQYFPEVFTPLALFILGIGTVSGLLLGATPGLSPTMAVALLIPFTFHMQPAHGLILLGAAYTSSVAGSVISAVLLKIPRAPANIATALDGFAMARRRSPTNLLSILSSQPNNTSSTPRVGK